MLPRGSFTCTSLGISITSFITDFNKHNLLGKSVFLTLQETQYKAWTSLGANFEVSVQYITIFPRPCTRKKFENFKIYFTPLQVYYFLDLKR